MPGFLIVACLMRGQGAVVNPGTRSGGAVVEEVRGCLRKHDEKEILIHSG